MKKICFLSAVFALLFLAQLAVPLHMTYESECALSTGEVFRFKCRFYDPKDIFRGNYLQLRLEDLPVEYVGGIEKIDKKADGNIFFSKNDDLYVSLERNEKNEAKIVTYYSEKPVELNHLKVEYAYYNREKNKIFVKNFGFEKYFVNEKDAPYAEKVLEKFDRNDDVYLVVSIKNGRYTVQDILMNGKSIRDEIEYEKEHAQ